MTQYFLKYEGSQGKEEMRKWIGKTSGVSIAKSDEVWVRDHERNSVIWYDGYVVDVKNKKTEMLLLLQYPEIIDYTEVYHQLQEEYR